MRSPEEVGELASPSVPPAGPRRFPTLRGPQDHDLPDFAEQRLPSISQLASDRLGFPESLPSRSVQPATEIFYLLPVSAGFPEGWLASPTLLSSLIQLPGRASSKVWYSRARSEISIAGGSQHHTAATHMRQPNLKVSAGLKLDWFSSHTAD